MHLLAQTWVAQTSGTTDDLTSVYFTSDNEGWVAGYSGTILHTSNGGQTWNTQVSGTTNYLKDIYFASPTHGWAVGRFGTIVATTDGGATWTPQTSGISSANLQAVEFSSLTNGWIISDAGDILYTNNGGTTWTAQSSTVTLPLYGMSVISSSEVVICGANGIILNTYDGGSNWNALTTSGVSTTLLDVDFTSATNGWVVGDNQALFQSIDMGQTWSFSPPTPGFNIVSIDLSDDLNGIVGFSNGVIYGTTDGGASWINHTSGTTNGLYGIYQSTSGVAWAVGDMGTILTLNNTAGIGDELVEDQVSVFPNPAISELNITSDKEISYISIFSMDGRIVYDKMKEVSFMVPVENFEKGVYTIHIDFEDGTTSVRQFIKE
jgi:photosystem II stability/assembly factor-like uncharacterized protein